VLAYVFWHRPRAGVDAGEYEVGLRELHDRLDVAAASFRIPELPFAAGSSAYEDWYLVEGWGELGDLNLAAVTGAPREPHDSIAGQMAAGRGGLYTLLRGAAEPPASTRWLDKPLGEDSEAFLAGLSAPTVWRRQLVLGPAPEFCLVDPAESSPGRERI